MANKTYSELLRDPRWQRKRLEILERDNWTCLACGSRDRTLHVHHKSYRRGAMPWEYDGFFLLTLCEECHESLTIDSKAIVELVSSFGPTGAAAIRKLAEAFFNERSSLLRGTKTLEDVIAFVMGDGRK